MKLATSFTGTRGVRYPSPDVARGFMLLFIALANIPFWTSVTRSSAPGDAAPTPAGGAEPDAAAGPIAMHHFRCLLCGYVVETCDEELPEGFRCPMCGAGREMFKKID